MSCAVRRAWGSARGRSPDQRRIGKQIEALPSRQRVALGLFALDGWSYEQIGRHLGHSATAVKALIWRARCALRDAGVRWVGVVFGAGRAVRYRLQRRAVRMHAAVWPSFEAVGLSAANVMTNASAAVVAPAMACGLLAPGGAVAASVEAPEAATSGGALVPTPPPLPRSTATPGEDRLRRTAGPSARPCRPSPTGAAEATAGELVASALPVTPADDAPATIQADSFATSPDYDDDPAIFVAGGLEDHVSVGGRCAFHSWTPALLVSHDDGASWRRARAVGLAPVVRLLLSPAYPRDHRLFAVTSKGLQVSHDDGDTFETLVPLAQITDAALSPAFNAGDPTMLFVAGERLWRPAARSSSVYRSTRCYDRRMAREITQRELRNESGEIMRKLDEGETFVVTRNGVPVGELTPLRRHRFVAAETAVALFRAAPGVDYARFRADLDALADQDTAPRA